MMAVCISGQKRKWDNVKQDVIQNVFKEKTDVFFVCDEDLSISNIDHEITKELQSFYDESIMKLFNSRKNSATIVENCLNMFYKIMRCNQLKIKHENKHNFKYDIVVRLRTDTIFKKPISFSEEKDKIFIPNGCDWGGICDQFAYGSSELMDKFCDVFPNIKTYFEEGCEFHPEKLLNHHCNKLGIDVNRQDIGPFSIER